MSMQVKSVKALEKQSPLKSMMSDVQVKPVTLSKPFHQDCVEALPVYDVVRRWLELQPEKIVEGTNPVYVLKLIVENMAKQSEGSVLARLEAQRVLSSILE